MADAAPTADVRIGYLGPEGTFTQEALLSALETEPMSREPEGLELVPLATVQETIAAVHDGIVDRALVPIENSIEGSVNATLDALVFDTEDVEIVGEIVQPISQCLIAREPLALEEVEVVVSHPQATGQCGRFLRSCLPRARMMTSSSTADAVRLVAEHGGRWAALGNRLAAERYDCQVLRAGVEDRTDNETRFVWLASGRPRSLPRSGRHPRSVTPSPSFGDGRAPWKTAIVFWGAGSDAAGWLVDCLAEFATRGINLTRIESRPRKLGLGRYIFFLDLEGRDSDPGVSEAIDAVRGHVETLRVLGSFPAAI